MNTSMKSLDISIPVVTVIIALTIAIYTVVYNNSFLCCILLSKVEANIELTIPIIIT